jgi:hypothetical protein
VTHAKNGLRLAQEQSAYNEEAICTTLLGRALEESGQLDEALVQFEHARSSFASLPRPYFAIEPLAGLARVALARGDLAGALVYIEAVLIFLAAGPCTGLNEPFLIFLSCVRVLQALGDERASEVLRTAHARLHEYASRITDVASHYSFLENVATHRELDALWQTASLIRA